MSNDSRDTIEGMRAMSVVYISLDILFAVATYGLAVFVDSLGAVAWPVLGFTLYFVWQALRNNSFRLYLKRKLQESE